MYARKLGCVFKKENYTGYEGHVFVKEKQSDFVLKEDDKLFQNEKEEKDKTKPEWIQKVVGFAEQGFYLWSNWLKWNRVIYKGSFYKMNFDIKSLLMQN